MPIEYKIVLVIGGAGYVGSQLVPALLKAGCYVIVIDLFIYGDNTLPDHKNLLQVKGDIRNYSFLKKYFDKIDAVIHLARAKTQRCQGEKV